MCYRDVERFQAAVELATKNPKTVAKKIVGAGWYEHSANERKGGD